MEHLGWLVGRLEGPALEWMAQQRLELAGG